MDERRPQDRATRRPPVLFRVRRAIQGRIMRQRTSHLASALIGVVLSQGSATAGEALGLLDEFYDGPYVDRQTVQRELDALVYAEALDSYALDGSTVYVDTED